MSVLRLVTLFVAALLLCTEASGHGGAKHKHGCHVSGKVPAIGDEDVLNGRVVSVTDGDTFKAKIQGAVMTFRMADIDAPELDQPYGPEARVLLKGALSGKDAVMLRVDHDSYGRFIVQVWIGNLHINREVVARGAAWFYTEYAHDDCLYPVENEARGAKRGLWALPREQRLEPWVWRERKRNAR